jgi:polar amino acid transport system substrate-binding protein
MSAKESRGKVVLAAKQISSAPTAFAIAQDNPAFLGALNKALDEVIKDGTWTRLQDQYYPGRPVPTGFKPGSGRGGFPPLKAGTAS